MHEIVVEMMKEDRDKFKLTYVQLAEKYKVGPSTVWRHLRGGTISSACKECGKLFTTKLPFKRFCSQKCRHKAYNRTRRQRGAANVG